MSKGEKIRSLVVPLKKGFTAYIYGDRGGTVVKVLCYKSEGRWCQWIFH